MFKLYAFLKVLQKNISSLASKCAMISSTCPLYQSHVTILAILQILHFKIVLEKNGSIYCKVVLQPPRKPDTSPIGQRNEDNVDL